MADIADADAHPLDTMLAVSDIITNRRLARVYTHVIEQEEITVAELTERLDSSRTTVYEDVGRVRDLGLLECVTDTQPHRYRATEVAMTVEADETTYEITPVLIAALAYSEYNDNLELYVDRHGVSGLASALDYARDYLQGRMNARIMARELDITVVEAETILQELRDVIRTVEPDLDEPLDVDELDAAVDDLPQE